MEDLQKILKKIHKNPKILPRLIEEGFQMNEPDQHGRIPLIDACTGYPNAVAALLECGASVKVTNRNNTQTPLIAACEYSYWEETVPLLLKYKAKVNQKDKDGETPFMKAVKHKSDVRLLDLLKNAGADIDMANNQGVTPLMEVAKRKPEFVTYLLNNGAKIGLEDIHGYDALTYAFHPECFKLLVERGSKINRRYNENRTVLMEAFISSSSNEELKLLLKEMLKYKINVNAKDDFGRTALIHASLAYIDDKEIYKQLVHCGADINIKDKRGLTVLDYVKDNSYHESYEMLVEMGQIQKESKLIKKDINQKMASNTNIPKRRML